MLLICRRAYNLIKYTKLNIDFLSYNMENTQYSADSMRNRMMKMLNVIPKVMRMKFQYDAEASWSFTDLKIGYALCEKMYDLGISRHSIITDATASVGGNTIAFAKHFGHVHAIELNTERKIMLDNNIKLLRLTNVTTHQGFGQEIAATLTQDVVFFDPPWGNDYKKYTHGTLQLQLSGSTDDISLEQIIADYRQYAKYCVIKIPINYNIGAIDDAIKDIGKIIFSAQYERPNTALVKIIKYN